MHERASVDVVTWINVGSCTCGCLLTNFPMEYSVVWYRWLHSDFVYVIFKPLSSYDIAINQKGNVRLKRYWLINLTSKKTRLKEAIISWAFKQGKKAKTWTIGSSSINSIQWNFTQRLQIRIHNFYVKGI